MRSFPHFKSFSGSFSPQSTAHFSDDDLLLDEAEEGGSDFFKKLLE